MGRAELSPQMVAALLCREMKWTYEEYANQPTWFISTLFSMLRQEAEELNRRNKKP